MGNIRHSLDVLLPWQWPISKKQKLKNKGNYVGNLTGKSQAQRLQDNRTRVSFVTLASSYSHFCRNSREPTWLTYSFSFLVEHRSSTSTRYLTLFCAASFASRHVSPLSSNSDTLVRLQVCRGLTLLCFPCGFHSRAAFNRHGLPVMDTKVSHMFAFTAFVFFFSHYLLYLTLNFTVPK